MGGVKRSKESIHNIVWSQSVLTTSFGNHDGVEKPEKDLHVTAHSTINIESISHKAPTNTKDDIDIKPRIKIKCNSNLNHHNEKILQKIENECQLIDEQFLEEPASTDTNLADPTESCDRVHGMLTINYKPSMKEEV